MIGDLKGPDGEVQVRRLKSIRLHVRAIIRDGTRAFVGSQSLRKEELQKRREVGLLISNPTVTRKLMHGLRNRLGRSGGEGRQERRHHPGFPYRRVI